MTPSDPSSATSSDALAILLKEDITLRKGEEVGTCVRVHIFSFIRKAIILSVLLLIVLIAVISSAAANHSAIAPAMVGLIVALLVYAFLMYKAHFDWRHNIYAVTNMRIIDYNRYFPWRKSITEANLDRIQDTHFNIPGLFGRLLGYGSVKVETAGTTSPFKWNYIPNPQDLQRLLRTEIENLEARAASPAASIQEGDLKSCPYCAEKVRVEAKKCRYCGSDLPT